MMMFEIYLFVCFSQKKHRQTMIKPYCSFVSTSQKKTTISPLKKKNSKKLAGCFLKASFFMPRFMPGLLQWKIHRCASIARILYDHLTISGDGT